MLHKSLIQFSVDGQGCLPSLFDLRPNYGGHVMTIMGTSFKRPPASTAALSAPEPAAGRCWSTPLLETPGHTRASLGQSSGVTATFSWWAQGSVCALQESVSPVPWGYVRCHEEQYCIGIWNVRSMNQGKLDVVKQKMTRVNVNILGIKRTKMDWNRWI